MVCPECHCPAMWDQWLIDDDGDEETGPMESDELGCPNCGHVVPIGTWIPGRPAEGTGSNG